MLKRREEMKHERSVRSRQPTPSAPSSLEKARLRRLLASIVMCDWDSVVSVLQTSVDINGELDGETPLMKACREQDVAMVEMLLDRGANVNRQTSSGTALTCVAGMDEDDEIMDLLLLRGATLESRDASGKTPLLKAASCCNVDGLQRLLEAGANISARDNHQWTALMLALEGEYEHLYTMIDTVLLLLNSGLDVHESSQLLDLNLRFAGRDILIALLFAAGVDRNVDEYRLWGFGSPLLPMLGWTPRRMLQELARQGTLFSLFGAPCCILLHPLASSHPLLCSTEPQTRQNALLHYAQEQEEYSRASLDHATYTLGVTLPSDLHGLVFEMTWGK
jgi:hypothetical protein